MVYAYHTKSQERTEDKMAKTKKKNYFDEMFPEVEEFIGKVDYADLVLTVASDGQYILAEAPFGTNIKGGESLAIANEEGIVTNVTAISSICMDKLSPEFDFLIAASIYELPLPKVVSRIKCEVVKWE